MFPAVPSNPTFRLLPLRLLAVLLLAPIVVWGHGDLHESIAVLDREILARPGEAVLYLQRGELHRKHEDWLKAAADYDRAAALDPALAAVDLARGALGVEARRPEAAREALDRFIGKRPDDPAGYAARARLSCHEKQPAAAGEDFARAIALSPEPAPELFLDHAAALRDAGRAADAVAILDAGIAKRGPLVTLAIMALDLETTLGRTDAALRRVDALIAAAPRKEGWLHRRGDILEKAGRAAEARAAYELALAAIAVVPEYRRATEATRTLQTQIEAALRRVQP
jgi:predicted Zn-dependent protease